MSISDELKAEVEEVIERDKAWVAAGHPDKIVNGFLADDMTMMAPGMAPVRGKAEVAKWYKKWFEAKPEPPVPTVHEQLGAFVAESKDLACAMGIVHVTVNSENGPRQEHFKYIIIYRKIDGVWMGEVDFFTPEPAAA